MEELHPKKGRGRPSDFSWDEARAYAMLLAVYGSHTKVEGFTGRPESERRKINRWRHAEPDFDRLCRMAYWTADVAGLPDVPRELFQSVFACVALAEHADTDPRERGALGVAVRHYWNRWRRFHGLPPE